MKMEEKIFEEKNEIKNLISAESNKIPDPQLIEYIVKKEDSIYGISLTFDMNPKYLMKINNLSSDYLFPGQNFEDKTYITYDCEEIQDYDEIKMSVLPYKPILKNCVLNALGFLNIIDENMPDIKYEIRKNDKGVAFIFYVPGMHKEKDGKNIKVKINNVKNNKHVTYTFGFTCDNFRDDSNEFPDVFFSNCRPVNKKEFEFKTSPLLIKDFLLNHKLTKCEIKNGIVFIEMPFTNSAGGTKKIN